MLKEPCPDCFGNGYFVSSNSKMVTKCPKCKGIGIVKSEEKAKSNIQNHKFFSLRLFSSKIIL